MRSIAPAGCRGTTSGALWAKPTRASGAMPMQDVVGQAMGAAHVADRPPCGRPVAPAARRPVAGDEGVLGVHRGLVDGEPPAHPIPEVARDELDVAGEPADDFAARPAAPARQARSGWRSGAT